jgi:hypothetical protein
MMMMMMMIMMIRKDDSDIDPYLNSPSTSSETKWYGSIRVSKEV